MTTTTTTSTKRSVIAEIAAERYRQIEQEGWTAEHDDRHQGGDLAKAGACYAYFGGMLEVVREVDMSIPIHQPKPDGSAIIVIQRMWPWRWVDWKPKDRRRDLIRAAALIVAEIERLDRLKSDR